MPQSKTVLSDAGQQDITAHVNFSFLRKLLLKAAFQPVFEGWFAQWATTVWNEAELTRRWASAGQRWRLQWKHLLFGFGPSFRVIHVRKATPK